MQIKIACKVSRLEGGKHFDAKSVNTWFQNRRIRGTLFAENKKGKCHPMEMGEKGADPVQGSKERKAKDHNQERNTTHGSVTDGRSCLAGRREKSKASMVQTRKSEATKEQTRKNEATKHSTRKSEATEIQTRKSEATQEQTRKKASPHPTSGEIFKVNDKVVVRYRANLNWYNAVLRVDLGCGQWKIAWADGDCNDLIKSCIHIKHRPSDEESTRELEKQEHTEQEHNQSTKDRGTKRKQFAVHAAAMACAVTTAGGVSTPVADSDGKSEDLILDHAVVDGGIDGGGEEVHQKDDEDVRMDELEHTQAMAMCMGVANRDRFVGSEVKRLRAQGIPDMSKSKVCVCVCVRARGGAGERVCARREERGRRKT